MANQTAFSSSSSTRKYEVFLSFCGVDTRKNFTDHLYTALKQKGIITFRDDEKLERGKYISEELLKAIEESDYAIIVLSKNYASSRWCLIELAKIVECTKKTGLIVFPVFYHVDPSDIRNQTGTLGEAFTKHEKDPKVNIDDVPAWKAALIKVGNISGWHLHDGHESKVIEEMVGKILGKLTSTYSNFHKDLVGINYRVEEFVNLLGMGSSDVRFIGIWGMGGMGKTTLAQVFYDRFHDHFERSSFLANVREESGKHGLVSLQKRLLFDILIEKSIDILDVQMGINVIFRRFCHKKVLIILDDVDHSNQLEALVGKQSWFGQGSRIIITTRDQHLLIRHEVDEGQIYKVKGLNDGESLKLFSQTAFKKDHPLESYVVLSLKFIYYAKGLPLALKVLGSFLCHRSLNLWESTLTRYKENPPKDILDVLQISFDGLEEREKNIYLDIACFFNGGYEDDVRNILQILYDKPDIDIDVLLKKSLITISSGFFQMHDLLQELGREIVRRESPEEAGKRSRLWHSEDVLRVLKENTGTKSVKGIFLKSPSTKVKHSNVKAFSEMKNLRLLKISNVHLPQGLNYLSSELRSLHWDGCPLESMPTSFEPEKLVELIMRSSLIKQLWKGFKGCDELKHIDLSDSKNLIEIPDLSGVPNLEQLILRGCTTLHRIHESLGNLKRLIQLDLKNCKCLEILPHKINLESLEIFDLYGCSKLIEFPKIVGNMSHLLKLYLCKTAIKALPLSLEHLTSVTILNLCDCKYLDELPKNLGNMKGLEKLDVSGTAIKELPSSIIQLSNLNDLLLCGCTSLQSLPELPLNLKQLILQGCSRLSKVPASLGDLKRLIRLDLNGCKCLESLPQKISLEAFSTFTLSGCSRLKKFPEVVGNMSRSLRNLNLSGCSKLDDLPKNLGNIKGLEKLDASGTAIKELPLSIIQLSNLTNLFLCDCMSLQSLPELPLNLEQLILHGCSRLSKVPASLGNLKRLIHLDLNGCKCLESLPQKISLEALSTFTLSGCSRLKKFPEVVGNMSRLLRLSLNWTAIKDLPLSVEHLIGLIHLDLRDCSKLDELPENLGNIKTLEGLDVSGTAITRLPLSIEHLIGLIKLDLRECKNLSSLPNGCYNSMSLKNLNLSGCSKLDELPENLGNIKTLEGLDVSGTAITRLPLSIERLIGLIKLDLRDCKNLSSLPNGCYNSMSLKNLNLSGCSKLDELPENLGNIKTLEGLDVSGTAITRLPLSIERLIGLIKLDLRDCKNLSSLPNGCYNSMSLKNLNLSGCSKLDALPENLGNIKTLEELDVSGTAIIGLPSSGVHLKNLKVLSLRGCVGLSSKSFNKLLSFPLMQPRRSPNPMGMLECSLIKLDLSYCNLLTIPNVIGCLSSLMYLNLRGNNFVSLPESIIQLSNLRHLYMGVCVHLRMLPKLPLNIHYIDATKCTSLETISLRPESDFRPTFRLLNCDKLIKNQGCGALFSTMLRRYIINHQDDWTNSVEIPGSEIPKWFSHQNGGASVSLQVPSDLLGNKLMGIAVCVVFVFRQHHPLHQLHIQDCGYMIGTHYLGCSIGKCRRVTLILSEEFGKIESCQLWLRYFPSAFFGAKWKEILNQVDANGFSQIEVKFEPKGQSLEVTKCGGRLVFERDIEDLNQIEAGSSNCIITPYDEDGFEDSEKDTKIKRSNDDSDREFGPNGEATSNDKPPRLNLIENWYGNLRTQG